MIDRNKIPPSWEVVKLGELISALESGKRPKGGVQGIETGIPSVGGEHLNNNGGFDFSKIKFVPVEFANYMIKGRIAPQDIIVVKDGATTGKTSFVGSDFPYEKAVINEHVFIVRVKECLLPKYAFYKLYSQAGKNEILHDFRGAAQGGISSKFVMFVQIPLPPLPEQHRIVAKIEELFSELDKGVESLKTAQQQLKIYRLAVLKWAFEGRLTHEDVKEGELPEGWKLLKLKDITKEKDGLRRGPFGSAIKKEFFVADGYKVYEQGNAINDDPYRGKYFIDEKKYQELINFEVIPGDLIVSCSGVTLGRVSEIPEDAKPGIINQALLRIRLKNDIIGNKYFILHFRTAFFQKKIFDQSQGTAMPNLVGIKDFKEIELFVPPKEEQHQIVLEIETRLSVCDKLEETITTALQQSEALRQSILKKAFEGKLVEQNPKDEPASKLLERIKAESESNGTLKKKIPKG
ncbi:hypothetical protein BIY37_00525 [Candidatus Brocadia sapporoensis]|uniref:Type I restriction modification DNA specificity domain-containing protein n=1 Tax=Candidatus Brocadia sapporoensis TaxID=392547 RepID=A0A1V6M3F5_9BACT|nr:restriction endonuclease subunit S [Candidatus Brocadia sapporoensis]MDG6004346.1 hypothetical protein [Candidatus Brocadia sp.]OQD46928.1 hypothetical protein BIY37_00525 [Candidatus Brocadia sapporoensis]GJQ23260.1 MAG: hypothetical protein HBSAPP01_10500 [Candidatus Brocadia sapporoensis]